MEDDPPEPVIFMAVVEWSDDDEEEVNYYYNDDEDDENSEEDGPDGQGCDWRRRRHCSDGRDIGSGAQAASSVARRIRKVRVTSRDVSRPPAVTLRDLESLLLRTTGRRSAPGGGTGEGGAADAPEELNGTGSLPPRRGRQPSLAFRVHDVPPSPAGARVLTQYDADLVKLFGGRRRLRLSARRRPRRTVDASATVEVEGDEASKGRCCRQPLLAIRGRYFDDAVAALIDGRIAVAVAGRVLNLQQNLNCPGAGTAGCVWDGAVLLSRFLERHASEWVRNRSVLELGSGIGLAGIAAGVLGARRVVLTDLGENLELLERNVRDCQAQWKAVGCQEMLCRECDWTRPPERLTSDDGFDVILVADCVWMEHLVDPLLATVGTFVEWAPKSCDVRVLFSYQRRGRSTDDRFWAGLRQRFAAVDILDEDLCQPDVLKLISCRGAR